MSQSAKSLYRVISHSFLRSPKVQVLTIENRQTLELMRMPLQVLSQSPAIIAGLCACEAHRIGHAAALENRGKIINA